MTDKPLTSTERNRRSRAAAKLGLVWVAGYVTASEALAIDRAMADAETLIKKETDK